MADGIEGGGVRRAHISDLDAIERLENDLFDGDKLSRRSLRYYLRGATADFLVFVEAGAIDAYALTAFRRGSRIARLYSIAVARRAAGRGIGRRLLAVCEAGAAARGARALRLEVRTDNAAAIRLYQAMGYREFSREEDYYEDGAAALRFEKALPAA